MTPKDMMVADANAVAMGIPKTSLMESAGRSVAEIISNLSEPCNVVIYAGNGGNGGDGFVAARYLVNMGFNVEVFFLNQPCQIKSKETLNNWEILQKMSPDLNNLSISIITDSTQLVPISSEIIVDGLLGTGVHGKIREPFLSAINISNNSSAVKVAIDIPSGLDPLTGKSSSPIFEADHTITFHKAKEGLKIADKKYVGKIHVVDIGIPYDAEIFTGPGDLLRYKKPPENSHKGQNGRILVIGGSKDYSGAPAIAALAAMASGVDLSIIACPANVVNNIRNYSPDLIVKGLSNDAILPGDVEEILKIVKTVDTVVIGCGIGREDGTKDALKIIMDSIDKPIVLDADALKLLDVDSLNRDLDIVLTPHAYEFKSFYGWEVPSKMDEKIKQIRNLTNKHAHTILLKGKIDIIGYNGNIRMNKTGNPGMTVGGTGDSLAGVVGGLMSRGHSGFEAAFLGAYVNGLAGDMAEKKYGFNFRTSQLLDYIPFVLKND